jgi:diketogulonate reductase-like aldo/keto reductase
LAWLIRIPNVVAIPGASSVEQLESNAASADVELSDSENAQLEDAADRFEPLSAARLAPSFVESITTGLRQAVRRT